MASRNQNSLVGSNKWKRSLARQEKEFEESELYHRWYRATGSGNPNDYFIAITAHPGYTLTSGTGKTTFAASLAKNYFHVADEPFDAEKHYTLDIGEFAYEKLPNAEKGSCIIGDEMQGTAASTNLNSKRSQKTEALQAYGAVAGDRKNRTTKILVFQTLRGVNKDFFDFIDSWLLIVDDQNYRANHYKVVPEVFNLGSSKLTTPRVETLTWESLDEDDPDYQHMETLKDQANEGTREYSDGGDSETLSPEEARRKERIEIAQRMRSKGEKTTREIADEIGMSHTWVVENTDSPEEE